MLNALKQTNEIFVVDDDSAVRDALSMALRSEGFMVESFASAAALLSVVRMRSPAAIVLDVMLPDQSGLDILKALRAENYPAPVVMITGHGDIPMAVEAIKHGAYDFVEKPFSMDVMLDQLRGAMSSHAKKDEHTGSGDLDLSNIGGSTLTPREREVLREIATGASSKEAGRTLGISPRTVEVHRARIMDKLGARNAADLMRIIFSHNG
ncbi:MAG: response regulator transcription factor [Methylocystis sp.]|jgi:two-component system response regulator FixJ|nr:response regulator transcription factor [Methylocystis sp.]MCA3582725.1 response regulator transcription factor [Methylocystis sp.]MCA3587069.1 response regulator transcription factor [Methylocystis sp.]MCA3592022.1 response regulator transcription factor [Methylocystis sp.]